VFKYSSSSGIFPMLTRSGSPGYRGIAGARFFGKILSAGWIFFQKPAGLDLATALRTRNYLCLQAQECHFL